MIFINLLGVSLIVFIIWWFWLYKPKELNATEKGILITVENGTYQPSRIMLPANQAVAIQFLRKDASPCAEMVLFPDLNISEELTLNKTKLVNLPAMEKGEYSFHCQMQMYRGSCIVN